MKNMKKRIQHDLPRCLKEEDSGLLDYAFLADITEKEYRYIGSWVGASMVASMSTFASTFVTRDELNEVGDKVNIFKKVL